MWRVDGHESSNEVMNYNIVDCSNGKAICTMLRFNPYAIDEKKILSDAKIIAAAPELLNACQKVMTGGYGCAPSVEFMDNLKRICESAINKATE